MINDTLIDCDVSLTKGQKIFVDDFSWWLDIFTYVIVGMIGLTLNMLAIWILLSPNMWNNIFNRLIMCLSSFDTMFILCGLLEILRKWMMMPIQQYLFAKVVYPFRSMAMCCSIYTTIVLTLERYQAITSPIQHRNRNANIDLGKRLAKYIVPVCLLSFLYYLPKFFDLYVKTIVQCGEKNESIFSSNSSDVNGDEIGCQTEYKIFPTRWRLHQWYILWYLNASNVIVTCVVPVGILVYMNCRIANSMQAYRQRRCSRRFTSIKRSTNSTKGQLQSEQKPNDIKQTFILFSIVTLFVVCHTLRILMNISELLNLDELRMKQEKGCDGLNFLQHIAMPLSEILLLCNSSANFFVFLCFDRSFQLVLKERFFALTKFSTNPIPPQNENLSMNTHRIEECRKSVVTGNEVNLNGTSGCRNIETAKSVDTSSQNVT